MELRAFDGAGDPMGPSVEFQSHFYVVVTDKLNGSKYQANTTTEFRFNL